MKLGVAMSGGGHRASAWGAGVLAAVVDAGLGDELVSVSSVSGGSITNGVVAQNVDLRTATAADFDRAIGPALHSYAEVGLFPNGPLTKRYFITVKVIGALTALCLIALIALAVIGIFAGGSTLAWITGAVALAFAVALTILLWLLRRRGDVVLSATARTHFDGDKRSLGTSLASVDRSINHVILTTDLEAADQFYLAPKFLYGYREGVADPARAGTALAQAVQASAGLPGAFPPIRLHTGTFDRPWSVRGNNPATPPSEVWLSDGGVYDNMGDQWENGIKSRIRRWPELETIQQPAEILIVANASQGWEWEDFTSTSWPGLELMGLRRVQSVQYDVSTARRRRAMVQKWRANESDGDGQRGVIVMIDRSPWKTASDFARGADDTADRARKALEFLGDEKRWDELAAKNAKVGTILDKLTTETTVDLMEHAYVSTLVGLYVIHGIGSLIPFDRARFEALCRG